MGKFIKSTGVLKSFSFLTAFALVLGAPWPGWTFPLAAVAMLAGVLVHVTERHGHLHSHEPLEHEHMHGHDDGHGRWLHRSCEHARADHRAYAVKHSNH